MSGCTQTIMRREVRLHGSTNSMGTSTPTREAPPLAARAYVLVGIVDELRNPALCDESPTSPSKARTSGTLTRSASGAEAMEWRHARLWQA
jgi:hypothetical protein